MCAPKFQFTLTDQVEEYVNASTLPGLLLMICFDSRSFASGRGRSIRYEASMLNLPAAPELSHMQ